MSLEFLSTNIDMDWAKSVGNPADLILGKVAKTVYCLKTCNIENIFTRPRGAKFANHRPSVHQMSILRCVWRTVLPFS